MKRTLLILALLAVSLAALAAAFVPKSWEFRRPNGAIVTVVIDYDGRLTVYENEQMMARLEHACETQ